MRGRVVVYICENIGWDSIISRRDAIYTFGVNDMLLRYNIYTAPTTPHHPPETLFVCVFCRGGGGILFSRCPSVRLSGLTN